MVRFGESEGVGAALSAWAITAIVIGVVVVVAIVAALILRPSCLRLPRSRDVEDALPGRGSQPAFGGDVDLALARAAYGRGDYLRVSQLLSSGWETRSLSAQLLFADACKELGTVRGDEASVVVFESWPTT